MVPTRSMSSCSTTADIWSCRQRRDGMWQLEGKLTNTVGAQLHAILDPLTRPRSTTVEIDGRTVEIADERHYGQRLHDGLEDACGRLLQLADRPAAGGTPASVIITVQLEDLLAKAGIAETTDGSQLSADQLLRIADQAEIWPTIIDRNGVPLALARTRRIATRGQTMALIAREGGCSFPGCDHPPQWCDRHHIIDWIDGGPTDLDNLTLLMQISPHPFPAERLDVSHQQRRLTGMDPAALDRPSATTPTQHPNPTPLQAPNAVTGRSGECWQQYLDAHWHLPRAPRAEAGAVTWSRRKCAVSDSERCRVPSTGTGHSQYRTVPAIGGSPETTYGPCQRVRAATPTVGMQK